MPDTDPLQRLERVAQSAEHPRPEFGDDLLDELLRELEVVDLMPSPPEPDGGVTGGGHAGAPLAIPPSPDPGARHLWRRGWLAAAAILVVGLAAALLTPLGDDGETVRTGDSPDAGLSEDQAALVTVEKFYAALETADLDGLSSVMALDAVISDVPRPVSMDEFRSNVAWNAAAGTELTGRQCNVWEPEVPGSVTVFCRIEHSRYLARAVGAPPDRVTDKLTVSAEGVAAFERRGDIGTFQGERAFGVWMRKNHPADADATTFGVSWTIEFGTSWPTVDEARVAAATYRRYADLWAVYLVQNDCSYLVDC